MNQTQIKYARERAAAIHRGHLARLKDKHTAPSVKLTTEEKLKALKAGKFKVGKPGKNDWWHNAVTFNDEVVGGLNQAAYDVAKAIVDEQLTKLNDELVLGDHQEALKLLEAFAAT